jgi:hypothetical protein
VNGDERVPPRAPAQAAFDFGESGSERAGQAPTEAAKDPQDGAVGPGGGARGARERAGWEDNLPDVRDGLTRKERVVLVCLRQAEAERPGRNVSTALLYGRVVEHVNIGVPEFQRILQRLVGVAGGSIPEPKEPRRGR